MTRRVPPARQVHPVPQGHKAHQAPRCPEDQKDHTAHRWYKGPKAIQAHGGFKDQKEIKGHRVPKVRQDHRGSKAEKATQVLKGLRVAQVHKAPKVTRVHKSPRVIQVSRALGVIQEHKAHMALKGQRVIGAQGPPGPTGPPGPKGKSGAIKPSHTAKNLFQYLMKDVNEWSTEDGVNVMKIDDQSISLHYWDKKVLFITSVKKPNFAYTFRLGLQMYRMATNHESIIAIEFYNKDALTYGKSKIYIQGTGVWIEGHETKKFTYKYGRTNFLYYASIMVKFKKTSGSPSVFL